MKKLLEHPIVLIIGLISSAIGIFAFITGISDIGKINSKPDTNAHLVALKDSGATNLYLPAKSNTLNTHVQLENGSFDGKTYVNTKVGFSIDIPSIYLISKGTSQFGEDYSNLFSLSMVILDSTCVVVEASIMKKQFNVESERTKYLSGYLNAFLDTEGLQLERSNFGGGGLHDGEIYDFGGVNLYSVKGTRYYTEGGNVLQHAYLGYLNDYFILFFSNAVTEEQEQRFKSMMKTLKKI